LYIHISLVSPYFSHVVMSPGVHRIWGPASEVPHVCPLLWTFIAQLPGALKLSSPKTGGKVFFCNENSMKIWCILYYDMDMIWIYDNMIWYGYYMGCIDIDICVYICIYIYMYDHIPLFEDIRSYYTLFTLW
jgi:hypothetical protein